MSHFVCSVAIPGYPISSYHNSMNGDMLEQRADHCVADHDTRSTHRNEFM